MRAGGTVGRWGRWRARGVVVAALVGSSMVAGPAIAQSAEGPPPAIVLREGRFAIEAGAADGRLARTLLRSALARDSFPGLPAPRAAVRIRIAPDLPSFRQWIGPYAPEWGAAVAFPAAQLVIMQGGWAGADAGEPRTVLRHELAHLALYESLGDLAPRWFDEGYASVAAGEWGREEAFETSIALIWRPLPGVAELAPGFSGGGAEASWHYALAHRAVAELLAIDGARGLGNLIRYWADTGGFEAALRGAYGMTGPGFDDHWHARTRSRYGALALISHVSLLVGVLSVGLVPVFVARRRRDRRRLEALRTHEAAQERAARESVLEALLGSPPS